MCRGSSWVILVFEPLVQLHMLVGSDDLKICDTWDTQALILQQAQGCGARRELVGPCAIRGSALPSDKGSADVEFVALVLEVAVTIERVATFVVQQTDLG